jgi:hypothetical protein
MDDCVKSLLAQARKKFNFNFKYIEVKEGYKHVNLKIFCQNHNIEFKSTLLNHLQNATGNCPECKSVLKYGKTKAERSELRVYKLERADKLEKHIKKQENFIEQSTAKFDGFFSYEKVNYDSPSNPVIITCSVHGYFSASPKYHMRSTFGGCPDCRSMIKHGKTRKEIEDMLEQNREDNEKRIKDLKNAKKEDREKKKRKWNDLKIAKKEERVHIEKDIGIVQKVRDSFLVESELAKRSKIALKNEKEKLLIKQRVIRGKIIKKERMSKALQHRNITQSVGSFVKHHLSPSEISEKINDMGYRLNGECFDAITIRRYM